MWQTLKIPLRNVRGRFVCLIPYLPDPYHSSSAATQPSHRVLFLARCCHASALRKLLELLSLCKTQRRTRRPTFWSYYHHTVCSVLPPRAPRQPFSGDALCLPLTKMEDLSPHTPAVVFTCPYSSRLCNCLRTSPPLPETVHLSNCVLSLVAAWQEGQIMHFLSMSEGKIGRIFPKVLQMESGRWLGRGGCKPRNFSFFFALLR